MLLLPGKVTGGGAAAVRAPPALDLEAEQPSEVAEHHGRHNGAHEHDDYLLRLADRHDAIGVVDRRPAGAPNQTAIVLPQLMLCKP